MRTHDAGMGRVNATVEDRHIQQVERETEQADQDISDAEAVRRIFDRAARAQELEQDLANCRATLAQEREDVAQDYEAEIQDLEQEIAHLETQIERLQRSNLLILERRSQELERYEEPGRVTRWYRKWFGR